MDKCYKKKWMDGYVKMTVLEKFVKITEMFAQYAPNIIINIFFFSWGNTEEHDTAM